MTNSLMDQLKKAGLVDKKIEQQAKKKQQKKERMQRNSNIREKDQGKQLAKEAQKLKKDRDRQLNGQRRQKSERAAITAQIKQLIEVNRLNDEGDIAYNFTHGNVVKRIYVTEKVQRLLGSGRVAIVTLADSYAVVPRPVAEKIAQRDENRVIVRGPSHTTETDPDISDDDPYADFQIPKDLMW